MTEFVSITIRWCPPGQSGPNECDLMRAMQDVAMLYKADGGTDAEMARAADWLHAKYGSKP